MSWVISHAISAVKSETPQWFASGSIKACGDRTRGRHSTGLDESSKQHVHRVVSGLLAQPADQQVGDGPAHARVVITRECGEGVEFLDAAPGC